MHSSSGIRRSQIFNEISISLESRIIEVFESQGARGEGDVTRRNCNRFKVRIRSLLMDMLTK